MSLWPALPPSSCFLRWLQTGALGQHRAHGRLTVILGHGGLEVGGRQVFGMGLMRAPLGEAKVSARWRALQEVQRAAWMAAIKEAKSNSRLGQSRGALGFQ